MSTAPNGWQNPKTNWASADVPLPTDFNRIEGNIQAIESGSRTLDPSQVPSGNTGSLRQLLDWFANRIRAITGATNWYDAPATTLAAAKSHMDATSGVHGATSSATANRIIIRDSAGRAKVAAPAASDDIARKAEVDAVSSAINTHKSSADHDGRYYTKSQLEPILRNLLLNYWIVFYTGVSSHLWGVAYGNGLWVAVGSSGTILTSTDGASWTSRSSGTTSFLNNVAYGNGLWVAVGNSGTILTSTNGTSWTSRTSGVMMSLQGVAYGNGLWVAVGTGTNTLLTSTDGVSWTTRSSGTSSFLRGVAYGNGLWVAVGDGGTIITSTNGTSWTSRTSGTTEHLNSVAYGNGLWFAVGNNGTILTSTDGISWTSRTGITTVTLYGVAYANGMLVLVGESGTLFAGGNAFIPRTSGTSRTLRSVAYGNGRWIAVGYNGFVSTSQDVFD